MVSRFIATFVSIHSIEFLILLLQIENIPAFKIASDNCVTRKKKKKQQIVKKTQISLWNEKLISKHKIHVLFKQQTWFWRRIHRIVKPIGTKNRDRYNVGEFGFLAFATHAAYEKTESNPIRFFSSDCVFMRIRCVLNETLLW